MGKTKKQVLYVHDSKMAAYMQLYSFARTERFGEGFNMTQCEEISARKKVASSDVTLCVVLHRRMCFVAFNLASIVWIGGCTVYCN